MGWFSSLVGGVVGFLVGGPVGAVIGAGIGATKVGEKVVNAVMDFVTQPFMGPVSTPDAASEAERQQGVLVQTTGSTVNIPIVYGYRKVGGTVVFAETGATNNKYLYVAYVFSEGLVEGLREVYIDDWLLPTDQVASLNGGQTVTVNADRYKDRVQLKWYPGTYFSNPKNSPVGAAIKSGIFSEAPSFTSNMHFNGLAVLFARYEWKEIKTQADADSNPFKGNIPEVQVAMLGKRVASLTIANPNEYTYDSAPVRYSTNPAEILLDYLRNPRFGKGLLNSDIDWDSWKIACAKCNTSVTYVASGVVGPILTLNSVVDSGQSLMSNTKTLLQNFRGYMPYVQGKYKLKIEDAGHPTDILSGAATIVQTFTKDDIVSDVTYNGIDRSSKYNIVSVTYVDPDQKFSNQQVVYPETEAERQIYIDRDGGRENKQDVTLGGITNYAIAKDMARLLFNKSRRQESCMFTATSKALEIEPGDVIRIQGNILNFSTDPWRVISVRINNDMTVELGCVRNPDDIYPYTRVGEEDVVLPPYIPKGSIIYYPGSSNLQLLGLNPPTNAVYPSTFIGGVENPGATDPNGSQGGGVGGGGSGSNNTASNPPPPPPFAAVLNVRSSSVTKVDDSNVIFNLELIQPNDGMYSYAILWWRYNSKSPWIEKRIDTLPGAGNSIYVSVGPLPGGTVSAIYAYYIRCFATDGRASTYVSTGKFSSNTSLNSAYPGLYEPQGTILAEGWSLPESAAAEAVRYDANIDFLEITPKLSAGAPLDPRRVKIRLAHLYGDNIYTTAPNYNLKGYTVYYKQKSETYWSYERFDFAKDWYPSQIVEQDLAGDFGARVYPTQILDNNSASGQLQMYDFMVRLEYKDGTSALKQTKPAYNRPVEYEYGLYNFNILKNPSNETITADFTNTFLTVDNQPGGAGADYATLVPSFQNINSDTAKSILRFRFNPIVKTRFRGFKIRYREVVEGQSPTFKEIKVLGVVNNSTLNTIDYQLQESTYSHGITYDWVITPLYSDTSGNELESDNSLVARAKVLFSDPQSQNLISKFSFRTKNTAESLGLLKAIFPITSPVNVKNWNKINLSTSGNFTVYGTLTPGYSSPGTNAEIYINRYYECKFQVPVTATALIVYRRVYQPPTSTTINYTNMGPWERVSIPVADFDGPDTDGWYLVRLRGPLTNYSLNIPGYDYPSSSDPHKITGVRTYAGAQRGTTNGEEHQYLFVIEDAGVERNRGLLLTDFYSLDNTSTTWKVARDAFMAGVEKVEVTDITAAYSTPITAGFGKRIDEAVDAVALDKLANYGTPKFPEVSVYNQSYTKFLLGLESGADIF